MVKTKTPSFWILVRIILQEITCKLDLTNSLIECLCPLETQNNYYFTGCHFGV